MFKIYLSILTCLLLLACTSGQRKETHIVTTMVQDSLAATSVEVDVVEYDFGTVAEGQMVEYNYRFKNTGNNPLIVTSVAASCGCTVPEKPEAPIKPGDTGFIKVKFDTQNRHGIAHKTITVMANTSPKFPSLILKGMITDK